MKREILDDTKIIDLVSEMKKEKVKYRTFELDCETVVIILK